MAVDIRWSSRYDQWTADVPQLNGGRRSEFSGQGRQAAKAKFYRMLADFSDIFPDLPGCGENGEFRFRKPQVKAPPPPVREEEMQNPVVGKGIEIAALPVEKPLLRVRGCGVGEVVWHLLWPLCNYDFIVVSLSHDALGHQFRSSHLRPPSAPNGKACLVRACRARIKTRRCLCSGLKKFRFFS